MQFTKATIHDLPTWEEGAVTHTPFVWDSWTNKEAIRQAIQRAEPIKSQKPGVYQVKATFEGKDSRLYIGVSWAGLIPPRGGQQSEKPQDLEGRIADRLLSRTKGQHPGTPLIREYVLTYFEAHQEQLRQKNISDPLQLLRVGWSICYEPGRLELLLHLKHDPLFPDKTLFPEKVLLDSLKENLVGRGTLLLKKQQELPSEQFRPWVERNLGISLQNAERYMNLARWAKQRDITHE